MSKFILFYFASIFIMLISPGISSSAEPIIRADDEEIAQWQAMRFGMFIHWGPVSVSGKEIGWSRASEETDRLTPWQEYDQFYQQFNPTKFKAEDWVSLAKQTGMKYIVYTSKHHDGFVNWDSKTTNYDIMSTPFKRDILQELSEECKEQSIAFGPYYSICDWYQPDYGYSHRAQPGYQLNREPDINKYRDYLKSHLREMHDKYGPFLVFWFDGEWEDPWTHEFGIDLNNFCKQLQPNALVNNRVDKGRKGMEGTMAGSGFAGDFMTPEQQIGTFNREMPWETCMTIAQQWAWKPDDKLKSLQECLKTLIYTVGGDGNLLLNVGPMPDGRIEERQAMRLREIGNWMEKYGDTIYGTRGGPFKPGEWGASTCKDGTINVFVLKWDGDSISLPMISNEITSVTCLTGGVAMLAESKDQLVISVPKQNQDPLVSIIQLKIDGDSFAIEPR